MKKIKLGDQVKDNITDLEGTVIAKATYLHGCTQCEVQPRKLKDGLPIEAVWVDEPQLEVIRPEKLKKIKKIKPRHGGLRNHPR